MIKYERKNRLTGLVYYQDVLRVLKKDACTKKKLFIVPADTTLLDLTLRRSAVKYFKTLFGEAATKNNVSVLRTEMKKGIGLCRYEHFVLFRAPSSLRLKQGHAESIFEDEGLLHVDTERQKLLSEIFMLACKELGLSVEAHMQAA